MLKEQRIITIRSQTTNIALPPQPVGALLSQQLCLKQRINAGDLNSALVFILTETPRHILNAEPQLKHITHPAALSITKRMSYGHQKPTMWLAKRTKYDI